MHGEDIGELNVYVRTEVGGYERLLFRKKREVGNFWERADIEISMDTQEKLFQIILEGKTTEGPYGDIALDDISITPGCMFSNQSQLPSALTTTMSTSTTTLSTSTTPLSTSTTIMSTSTTTLSTSATTLSTFMTTYVLTTKRQSTDIMKCSGDHCKNEGLCQVENNLVKCKCKAGFKGDKCESEDRSISKTFKYIFYKILGFAKFNFFHN